MLERAKIVSISGNYADITKDGASILRRIPVVGDASTLVVNQSVFVSYVDNRMVILTGGIKASSTASAGSGMVPHAMSYHTDAISWHVGLSGAQLHNPKAHASTHLSGGADPVDHNSLTNYDANRHIDHTTVTLTAGSGLTGGGDISASRTLDVNLDTDGGLEINIDAIRIKLPTNHGLSRTSSGLALGTPGTLTTATANAVTTTTHTHALSMATPAIVLGTVAAAGDATTLIRSNATIVAFDTTVPATLTAQSVAATGSVALAARRDHVHPITTSNDPGANVRILASSAAGHLTLVRLNTDTIADRSGGDLTISPTGDLKLNPTGAQIRVMASHTLQSDNYASQTTGWGITYAGGADFRYLFADEMHVKSFIADLEQALAGGQIISKSVAMLSRAFTAPAAGATATLYVWDLPSAEGMAAFESGDIVRLRTFSRAAGTLTVADCWGVVTSYSDLSNKEQSWTFTRSSGGNAGSMAASTVVAADSLALDYGTTGNGFHEVNAIDGAYGANSPYSQIVTWATHPATGQTVRTRLGNLYGITSTTEYGLYAGNGVTAASQYLRLTDQNFELHNLALRLYDNNNVQRIGLVPKATSTEKLMWAGASSTDPGFIVYGDGKVWLSTLAISEQMGDILFSQADGLALWGPGCAITPTSWTSTRGQVATISGAFHQVQGPWANSRALCFEPAATNLVKDPSFEFGTLSTYWANWGSPPTRELSTTRSVKGVTSLRLITNATNQGVSQSLTLAKGTKYTATVYVYCVSGSAVLMIYNGTDFYANVSTKVGQWQRLEVTVVAGATNTLYLGRSASGGSAGEYFFDCVQVEASSFATSYLDGSLGTGYAWTGTPHASTSTRNTSYATFNPSGVIDLSNGSMSFWFQMPYNAGTSGLSIITRGLFAWWNRWNTESFYTQFDSDFSGFRVVSYTGSAQQVNIYASLSGSKAGDWHHIVITTTTNSVNLYIDGVLKSTDTSYAAPAITSKTAYLGYVTASFGGAIAEFASFSRVLTAEEVAAMYARGKPLADAGAFKRPGIYIMDGEIDLRTSQTGARVQIDVDGIGGYSAATTKTFSLETDGDLFLGSDISAAATTALAVFANAQTYGTASESMGAGDVLLGDNSAGKINLLWDVSEGDVILRRGTSARITLDGSADSILIGQVAESQNNILISSGAISIRNNNVERIGVTAAGILTIKDSGGNAVITLDASAGAEITKTLAMKGASAAISIGETPPASATSGTGIWIDRTGLYSLNSDDYQVKIDATDGVFYAGSGDISIGSSGIYILEGTDVQNYIKWINSSDEILCDFTTYASGSYVYTELVTNSQGSSLIPQIILRSEVGDTSYHGQLLIGGVTSGGMNFVLSDNNYAYLQLVKTSTTVPRLRLFQDGQIEIDERGTHPTAVSGYGILYTHSGTICSLDTSGNSAKLGYNSVFGDTTLVDVKTSHPSAPSTGVKIYCGVISSVNGIWAQWGDGHYRLIVAHA